MKKELNQEQADLLEKWGFNPNDYLLESKSATNYKFIRKSDSLELNIYY